MTALDTLLINLPSTLTSALDVYCTYTSWQEADKEGRITTACLVASTILDSIKIPDNLLAVRDTYSYIESMSEDELAKASNLLFSKEQDFEILEQKILTESPKQYTKKQH